MLQPRSSLALKLQLFLLLGLVDPKRGSQTTLKRYAASFNNAFIVLRGEPQQVQALKQQFGVSVEKTDDATFVHAGSIFLMNPKGQWVAVFPGGLPSKQIETEFQSIIESTAHA